MPRDYVRTNPLLGHVECRECLKPAEVYQTKRSGRHFYTDGCACGRNDGTKAPRQQRIWDEAKFLDDSSVHRPSNVTDEPKGEIVTETVPDAPDTVDVDADQGGGEPADEDDIDIGDAPRKRGKGLIALGVVLLSTVGGVLWMG